MTNTITLKNAKVSFSTMLNKLDAKLFNRCFKVLVPLDSPELAQTIEQYKELNKLAVKSYGEQLGKKLKNAKSSDDMFQESTYKEGFVELNFVIFYTRKKEVEQEDGTKKEVLTEVLNPIYKTSNFSYKLDNNGAKQYECAEGKYWVPLSDNTINITYSLVAGYNSRENKPSIQLKVEEVEILQASEFNSKSNGPKMGLLQLSSDKDKEEATTKKVEKTKPSTDEEIFTEVDLSELDLTGV